jgi:G:T-mismatch repair DNA endonuclease (very short patch repair protein)
MRHTNRNHIVISCLIIFFLTSCSYHHHSLKQVRPPKKTKKQTVLKINKLEKNENKKDLGKRAANKNYFAHISFDTNLIINEIQPIENFVLVKDSIKTKKINFENHSTKFNIETNTIKQRALNKKPKKIDPMALVGFFVMLLSFVYLGLVFLITKESADNLGAAFVISFYILLVADVSAWISSLRHKEYKGRYGKFSKFLQKFVFYFVSGIIVLVLVAVVIFLILYVGLLLILIFAN